MNEMKQRVWKAVERIGPQWWRTAVVLAVITALVAGGCSREEESASKQSGREPAPAQPSPTGVSYAPAPLAGYSSMPPQVPAGSGYAGPGYGQPSATAPYGIAPLVDGAAYGGPAATTPSYPGGAAPGGYAAQPVPGGGGAYPAPAVGAAGYGFSEGPQPGAASQGYPAGTTQTGGWGSSDWHGGGMAYAPSTVTHPSGLAPASVAPSPREAWPQHSAPMQNDLYPSLDYDPSREAAATQNTPAAAPAPTATAAPAYGVAPMVPAVPTAPAYPYTGYGVYPPAYTAPVQPWAGLLPFFGGLPVW